MFLLQEFHKLVHGDVCLPKNTLKSADNEVAVHWYCDALVAACHLDVRTTLSDG